MIWSGRLADGGYPGLRLDDCGSRGGNDANTLASTDCIFSDARILANSMVFILGFRIACGIRISGNRHFPVAFAAYIMDEETLANDRID